MRNLSFAHCATAALVLLANACIPMQPGGASSPSPRSEPGKASSESLNKLASIVDQNVKQCTARTDETDKKLAEALDKLPGGKPGMMGKPTLPLAEVVAKLHAQKVTVTLDIVGSPEMPMLMLKDSFTDEGQKLAGAPPAKLQAFAKRSQVVQPLLMTLRDDINAVNATIQASFGSTIQCNQFAQGLTTQLGALSNGDNEPTPELFQSYATMLQANAHSKTVVAGSIALVAVMQAGFAGKDTKAIDQLLDGVKKIKDNPETVTEDQARKAYKAAGESLFDQCHEAQEKAYRDHPELKRPAVDPCSKEGSRVRGSPSEERARAEAAGGGDATDEAIQRLVPRDTPLADATDALAAAKKGDFLGALKGAAKLVGRFTPLGGTINSVLSLFG